jgi:uroporphyrinogen decarboxylase
MCPLPEKNPSKSNQSRRDNIIKAVRFDRPDYVPMVFHINESCWSHYPQNALKELIEAHPFLFPELNQSLGRTELDYTVPEQPDRPFTDGWGCVWQTAVKGIVGVVTSHPLENWDSFDDYAAPDPEFDSGKGPIDWQQTAETIDIKKAMGELTMGGLNHGHTFQRLTDIRGYENLLFDMHDGEPKLIKLIQMVEEFNLAIAQRYLELDVDWMSYPEDLGMQTGPMISPDLFVKYIKPSYERLFRPAREKGCIVHTHSDGDIRHLVDHLIGKNVDVINLQDLVNGLDWIEGLVGKICIELDIDRQRITLSGTPEQIDALIREEVKRFGSKQGGLMMIYGLYPGVPLKNVKALMDAMERYAFYYSG